MADKLYQYFRVYGLTESGHVIKKTYGVSQTTFHQLIAEVELMCGFASVIGAQITMGEAVNASVEKLENEVFLSAWGEKFTLTHDIEVQTESGI
jgi:hypothetical protein